LLAGLYKFTGPDWEQEDDVTMVIADRQGGNDQHVQGE
jgi:hypothetical protein